MNRPLCNVCGKNLAKKGNKPGTYKNKCNTCSRGYSRSKSTSYGTRLLKGTICEMCAFVPVHPCQLDIDHVNGDRTDNRPENLMTLCANCHRLKTHLNGDNKLRSVRFPETGEKQKC